MEEPGSHAGRSPFRSGRGRTGLGRCGNGSRILERVIAVLLGHLIVPYRRIFV